MIWRSGGRLREAVSALPFSVSRRRARSRVPGVTRRYSGAVLRRMWRAVRAVSDDATPLPASLSGNCPTPTPGRFRSPSRHGTGEHFIEKRSGRLLRRVDRRFAAAGLPPEPHERDVVIPSRLVPFACADLVARYKVTGHAGLRVRCAVPHVSETTRDYRQAEGAGLPHAVSDRANDVAPLFSEPGTGPAELSTVAHGHNSGSVLDRRTVASAARQAGR